MEVVIPTRPTMDFDFNSARSSPCITAPSTPRRFGDYNYNFLSAPTSPSRISEFYREFDEFNTITNWEDNDDEDDFASKPKSPKSSNKPQFEDDFAFDVGEEVERTSLSAEELFDGGVLRPFTPPPPPQVGPKVTKPTAPRSPSFLRQVLSPRRNKRDKDNHSFGSSSTRNTRSVSGADHQTRGRDRAPPTLSSSISGRRAARSMSPLRVAEYQWEEDEQMQQQQQQAVSQRQNNKQLAPKAPAPLSVTTACNPTTSSRKWRLRDFLLFRSASEGRATDKDPFRKYATLFRKSEEMKNASSSFRSIDSPASGSSSRRRGPVSAHELHYTVNKAVSEDMKKKTFLPYKQGILGRLAFNPAVSALANGFGSLSRS